LGNLTDSETTQAKGKAEQLKGKAEKKIGEARENWNEGDNEPDQE
jgi:uncharacterized protein YjbJ (UPF0337 family)